MIPLLSTVRDDVRHVTSKLVHCSLSPFPTNTCRVSVLLLVRVLTHSLSPSTDIVQRCVDLRYCFWWDSVIDWGLTGTVVQPTPLERPLKAVAPPKDVLQRTSEATWLERKLLRPTLFFRPEVYYVALVFNFVARIAWSIAISPAFCKADCVLGLGLWEMVRRCLWLLFKVEWEYIRLCPVLFNAIW